MKWPTRHLSRRWVVGFPSHPPLKFLLFPPLARRPQPQTETTEAWRASCQFSFLNNLDFSILPTLPSPECSTEWSFSAWQLTLIPGATPLWGSSAVNHRLPGHCIPPSAWCFFNLGSRCSSNHYNVDRLFFERYPSGWHLAGTDSQ